MSAQGEFIAKTGVQNSTPAVGDYILMRSGYWVRQEAAGLLSGPYSSADGVSFAAAAGGSVGVVVNDTSAAAANVTAIQAALDAGGDVRIAPSGGGTVHINATLKIGSTTNLALASNVELKAFGVVGNLLQSKAYTASTTTVTLTWASGLSCSVAWAAHGLSAGDAVWLSGNTDSAFTGVFDVITITDAGNFVIQLQRLPTASGGTTVARKANVDIGVYGGQWNYNSSGGNGGAGQALHAIILGGIRNLIVDDLFGKDTNKYLVNVGACSRTSVTNIQGVKLNSDLVKFYGPLFGTYARGFSGQMVDDIISIQTKEPAAFAVYRWCFGDVLGFVVDSYSGYSTTGALVFYPSPNEVMDGIVFNGYQSTVQAGTYHIRFDNNDTGTSATVGTVTLNNPVFRGTQHAINVGVANTLTVKNLVINNPSMVSTTNLGRFIEVSGITSANITINGGYITGIDSVVHANNATGGTLAVNLNGTVIGTSFTTFTSGINTTFNLDRVRFENNPGSVMLNVAAGNPTYRISTRNIVTQSNGVTLNQTGSPTIQIDGVDVVQSPVFSATPTWDFAKGQKLTPGTLTANITAITLSNIPVAGQQVVIALTQDATAGRTVVWPAACVFPSAWVDAIITTDANKRCVVTFTSNGTQLVSNGLNRWA